jgi:type IV pilus assembly protein PilA
MNTQLQKVQQGFTLIELMIVVAIIGILAAIAIPAYQDYTARAQASEAFALLDGFKTPIAESVGEAGIATGCDQTYGAIVSAVSLGKYVTGIAVNDPTTSTCKALATYTTSANPKISGLQVSLTYDISTNQWACLTSLPTGVRPNSCTYNATP